MSATKLTYFSGLSGRAEDIRYLLHYGGVEFKDEWLSREDFRARKNCDCMNDCLEDFIRFNSINLEFPLGQVPVLVFEGKTLYQTIAICRFLAKRFDLVGKNEWDSLQCDIALDTLLDVTRAMTFFEETDEDIKKEKRATAMVRVAFLTEKLESHLAKNDGHFVKGQLTWADFLLASRTGTLNYKSGVDIFADRPLLKALKAKVEALPAIKAYLEKRRPVKF